MAIIDPLKKFGVMAIRGKLGRPEFADPDDKHGIYQVRRYGKKKVHVREVFYQPSGSAAPAQYVQREKMKVCVTDWHGLSTDLKNRYRLSAKNEGMTGFNWFLHECLKTAEPVIAPFLLLETGFFLKQETGFNIELE